MPDQKIRRLHILPSKDGRFFVRITARNGRIVGDLSQTYPTLRAAARAATSMCAAKLVLGNAVKPAHRAAR